MKASLVFAIAAVVFGLALAQDKPSGQRPGQNPEDECCCTTYDTSVCLTKVGKDVDAELNGAYQDALQVAAQLSPKDVELLRDAERAWIAYRDADCEAEYHTWGGGTGGPNARDYCVIAHTRERISKLNSIYYSR